MHCGGCGTACGAGYGCTQGVCDDAVVDVGSFLATCAVLHGGEVWCWGRDVWGEIGIPPGDTNNSTCYQNDRCRTTPTKIAGLPDPATDPAIEVATGREATCVLTKSGAVWCFGSNEAGMLGHAPASDPICTKGTSPNPPTGRCSASPQRVTLPAGVVITQISMGTVNACALASTGDLYCWGSNADGQIAAPPSVALVPTPTMVLNGVQQVSVGSDISGVGDAICVLIAPVSQVECWGAGGTLFPAGPSPACDAGGDPDCTHTPTVVPSVFSPSSGAVVADAISIGALVGVAHKGGSVTVWGNDNYGQSGLGAASPGPNHFDPRTLGNVPSIAAVSAAGLTTLLLDTTGDVWALGWSDDGQIGNGTFANGTCPINNGQQCQDTPVKLSSLSGIAKIRTSLFDSAAITQDGKLFMWGTNYDASLGHAPKPVADGVCPGSTQACSPSPVLVTVAP
jgi:alpha-tubulin suppressor-like RCC1 family protein